MISLHQLLTSSGEIMVRIKWLLIVIALVVIATVLVNRFGLSVSTPDSASRITTQ